MVCGAKEAETKHRVPSRRGDKGDTAASCWDSNEFKLKPAEIHAPQGSGEKVVLKGAEEDRK